MLIGVCGYARSGKDTLGEILVQRHDFQRIAFADAVKDGVYRLNPWIPIAVQPENIVVPDAILQGGRIITPQVEKPRAEMRMRRVQEIVDSEGWEVAKEIPEVRRLLQKFGTEAGRDLHGDTVWVDIALTKWHELGAPHAVITDVRFPNEASAIQAEGGEVWRLTRPGITPANAHSSETEVDRIVADAWISNDGDIEFLAERVQANLDIAKARGR